MCLLLPIALAYVLRPTRSEPQACEWQRLAPLQQALETRHDCGPAVSDVLIRRPRPIEVLVGQSELDHSSPFRDLIGHARWALGPVSLADLQVECVGEQVRPLADKDRSH